ncbi:hypothetical protein [Cohnella fermenti]|uniref:Uncharacterized protein n=1 Tax=Cohnella fermenti TaxID=2565925 RepID=A0A4S4BTF8_9BACL|nr:hypothetical protein [Cohnella fermenti]THF78353.1 hypothetical protein E6C55_14135 [Cohnella fermenti]
MQPGLLCFVVWLAALILWWCGWRKELAFGVPEWSVSLFLAAWPFAFGRVVPLGTLAEVNLGLVLIAVAALAACLRLEAVRRWTALAAGLLLGSIALFLGKLAFLLPFLLAGNPEWAIAALVGTIAAVLLRDPLEQWLAVSLGAIAAHLADVWLHAESRGFAILGDSDWMAGWWLAIGCSRIVFYLLQRLAAAWSRLTWRESGERS